MVTTSRLFALAILIVAIPGCAAGAGPSDVDSLIARLDLTSFPNSTGPRRAAGRFTPADYGFTRVEKTEAGASLTRGDGGWLMSFEIVANRPDAMDICFHDNGLQGPGNSLGANYNTTSALRVAKSPEGRWPARQVETGFPNCSNFPPLD